MANPVESPSPTPDEGFDPLVFWIRHQKKIVAFLVLLVGAALAYAIYEYTEKRTHNAASLAFANSKTPEDYRKVILEYPNTAAAANAHLVLADLLRKDSKFDESNQLLSNFIAKFPQYQLLPGGYTSLGANQEIQKKLDEALMQYQKVTTSYPTSFSAPVAWLGQARIYKEQGKTEEAKRAYETVLTQFPDSQFAAEATRLNAQLKK